MIFVFSCSATFLFAAPDNEKKSVAQPSIEERRSPESRLSKEDVHALELGRKVIRVKSALKAPEKRASIDAVRELGLDSRYYVMVRGWILQHISMTESYKGTSVYKESEQRRKEIDKRVLGLRKMLRAIDLE